MRRDAKIAVVGGGLLGSAIAWGLGRLGESVVVLDEGDRATRASRANFALVWVQSKGLGMPAYTSWTVRASNAWGALATALREQTGLDIQFQRNGGFDLALSEAEMQRRADQMARISAQPGGVETQVEMLDHDGVARMMPKIGPQVVGGSFCPLDGHVNSLRAYRAFHTGLSLFGVDYRPNAPVTAIRREGGEFRLATPGGEVRAEKIVLAAGNANQALAPMVGLDSPMAPTRGQIVVTERVTPFLPHPLTTLRQSDEGTVMIGASAEDELDDGRVKLAISGVMADRARRMFPLLERINVMRTWSGVRVMPKDGFPVYDESQSHPGAFLACCHSGVTLASNHAFDIAAMIARGALDPALVGAFSTRRFVGAGDRP